MLALILRYRLLLWWRTLRSTRAARRAGGAFGAFITLILGLFALQFGYTLTKAADDPTSVLIGIFALFALFVLLFGISVALTELFVASDIDLLLTAPLRQSTLFALKAIDCSRAAAGVGALALCALIGWGAEQGAGVAFYLVALWTVVLFAIGLALLDIALVLLLTRLLPAKRLRDAVVLLGSVVGALLWLGYELSRGRGRSANSIASASSNFSSSPLGWAGHGLAAVAAGNQSSALKNEAALLALTIALGLIAYLLFATAYLQGLDAMRASPPGRRRARGHAPSQRPTPPLAWGAALKEWRLTRRDIPYLSSLLPSLIYACAFPVFFLLRASSVSQRRALLFEFGALPFVAVLAAYAPALAAVAREGAAFDVLRSSPARARDVIAGKTLAVGLPVAAIVAITGLVIMALRRAPAPMYALAIAGAAWLGLGCALIGVAVGAYNPKFEEAQTTRRGRVPTAGCLLYAGVAGLFCAGTFALVGAGISAALGGTSSAALLLALGALALLIGLATTAIAVSVGLQRLNALLAPQE